MSCLVIILKDSLPQLMNNLHGIHNLSTGEWIEIAYRIIIMCYRL